MIAPGDLILVAFSGGPDSTALLHTLLELRAELEFEVCTAHLNHLLRGGQSDADERWCSDVAQRLGLRHSSERIDVGALSSGGGANLEEVARQQRYRFLQRAAGETGAARIAVGHTADDQVETLLLRLLRGSGATGLRAMRPVRANIIRPLLLCTRKDVLGYLSANELGFREDCSNQDERFSRVFLRRRVTPLLRELNPSAALTVSGTAQILGDEDDFLQELAQRILLDAKVDTPHGRGIDADALIALHPALQRRVLRALIAGSRGSLRAISSRVIEALRHAAADQGPAVDLDSDWWAGLISDGSGGRAVVVRRKQRASETTFSYWAAPGQNVRVKEVDKSFALRIIETCNGVDISRLSGPRQAFLDADAVGRRLQIRNWQPGDRYRPLGAPGRQKLQDLFVNARIERCERTRYPVFLTAGRVCWVSGFRVSEDYKVTDSTRRVLSIEEV